MRVLVIGYGNPLRCDDGAGPLVARAVDALGLPGVEVRALHQLNPELADDLARYDLVFLIDASPEGPPVRLRRVEGPGEGRPSTHHFGSEALLRLARAIGAKAPDTVLCSVRGEEFGFGETLSETARRGIEEAVSRIVRALEERRGG